MKRVLVDMDGVLVDVYNRFFQLYRESTGKSMPMKDINGNNFTFRISSYSFKIKVFIN
ncbi:MAG TPA: hypothetical protein VMV77_05890 [Bacteroidales bacterium]|nr:hypothetical protein [Bacteroidales bacterium]